MRITGTMPKPWCPEPGAWTSLDEIQLKRKYGLQRSPYRGYDAVATGIGLGIFAHNVCRWAQRQAN